ncbi:hypothetical protein BCR33DRAFT_786731 [Rhizoclosmatium globosum]|uniref:Mini-chromosome maintenance complex-binding protein n=1 Tax=Rhizoclosmatium globosum TaxID=329046 RepID=A0A1Y2C4R1_9FUNG|nr:hypothetical protein BCR33DRAFT_786731 [Rhizoclosmatium globosum]|eukprot:ORY42022.1 hypothetical protein BCR33DRAFT_786731 [Rhizoclosmatium globosum]
MASLTLSDLHHLIESNGGGARTFKARAIESGLDKIPLFDASSSNLNHGLVRFRGMVQDNGFAPQIYLANVNVINKETGETVQTVNCHFADRMPLLAETDSKWIMDEDRNDLMFGKYAQKTPICCSGLPGQTEWMSENVGIEDKLRNMHVEDSETPNIHVHRKTNEPRDLQLGQIVDFVGFVEVFKTTPEEKNDNAMDSSDFDYLIQDELEPFANLPIIHVVFYEQVSPLDHPLKNLSVDFASARAMTLEYLLPHVFGDNLAAEYLLVHLITKMRARQDGIQTGNFPLNLHNIATASASGSISDASRVAPGVFVSQEHWKEMHPNASANELAVHGLVSGELQVPDRTYVVIDEVTMDSGILKEQGVINVRHLNDIISFGELPFAIGNGSDSPDHSVGKIPVDFSILVLSQAKCMFDIQCILPIQSVSDYNVPSVASTTNKPSEEAMNRMRAYIGAVTRHEDYSISEEMNELLTSFFISQRKETSEKSLPLYTQEAFMLRMEIARTLTLLNGEQTLTLEAWNKSGEMEAERLRRRAVSTSSKQAADGAVGR